MSASPDIAGTAFCDPPLDGLLERTFLGVLADSKSEPESDSDIALRFTPRLGVFLPLEEAFVPPVRLDIALVRGGIVLKPVNEVVFVDN